MLIRNYGLFWRKDWVNWRQAPQNGQISGIAAAARRSREVNFAQQQGVYCLYDETFRLVYIGQVGSGDQRLYGRLKQHATGDISERWSRFSWFGIRHVLAGGNLSNEATVKQVRVAQVLDHIEAILIASAEPVQNRQGGAFGKDVKKYNQERDGALGLEQSKMIAEVWNIVTER